jgi:hypothetical protein
MKSSLKVAFSIPKLRKMSVSRPEIAKNRFSSRVGLFGLALLGMGALATPAVAAETGVYFGHAVGTDVQGDVGPLSVSLAKTGFIFVPCVGTGGKSIVARGDTIRVGVGSAAVAASAVRNTIRTVDSPAASVMRTTARIEQLNMFGGLIRADAIVSASTTRATSRGLTTSALGTQFVNLIVAGQRIPLTVDPNTEIALPGLGTLILNRQEVTGNDNRKQLVVQGLYLDVEVGNEFGLPVGARVILTHARSGFQRRVPEKQLTAAAYTLTGRLNAVGVVRNTVGTVGADVRDCTGTAGETITQAIAEIDLPPVGTIHAGETQLFGDVVGDVGIARATSKVGGVDLLGGLVQLGTLKAMAQERVRAGVKLEQTAKTTVAAVRILGLSLPINVPADTEIALPLIGTLTLNEQIVPAPASGRPTQVNGMRLRVTNGNLLGLPIGTNLVFAHAEALALDSVSRVARAD